MDVNHDFYRIGLTAPDFMVICVDGTGPEGAGGRLYSCYDLTPSLFEDQYQLMLHMERVMESINYPQASVRLRSYGWKEGQDTERPKKPDKVAEQRELLNHRGEKATYAVRVQYRQNATWQGAIAWVEKNVIRSFTSELEMLKLIDNMRDN